MGIHEIRKPNYFEIRVQYEMQVERELGSGGTHGSLGEFGENLGISPRYLTYINAGRQRIGDNRCRKIEATFGLPNGWMDVSHLCDKVRPKNATERKFFSFALKAYRSYPPFIQALLAGFRVAVLRGQF